MVGAGQAPQRRHRALCVAITMYRYRKTVPEKSDEVPVTSAAIATIMKRYKGKIAAQ